MWWIWFAVALASPPASTLDTAVSVETYWGDTTDHFGVQLTGAELYGATRMPLTDWAIRPTLDGAVSWRAILPQALVRGGLGTDFGGVTVGVRFTWVALLGSVSGWVGVPMLYGFVDNGSPHMDTAGGWWARWRVGAGTSGDWGWSTVAVGLPNTLQYGEERSVYGAGWPSIETDVRVFGRGTVGVGGGVDLALEPAVAEVRVRFGLSWRLPLVPDGQLPTDDSRH